MFWEAVERLHRWERENLPGADTPHGSEVLIWLLKCQEEPRPLKHLYRSSRYSEPTLRACIRSYVDRGFVVLESRGNDMRTRYARATSKLEARITDYQERFREVATLAAAEGIVPATNTSANDLALRVKSDAPPMCAS